MQSYKYLLSFLLCVISLISCKKDLPQKSEKRVTKIEWKFIFKERKQYFMHLEKCDTLRTTFMYVNNTDSVQYIDTVRTSCGCTAVNYQRKPIEPGDSGEVKVAIDMYGIKSYFSKAIGVYFHNHKPVVLKVIGKVDPAE